MTGILDGHNIEIGSTPLNRLEETVATGADLQTHINDNTDPHGTLLRQTTIAINDTADIMSSGNGLKIVDFNNLGILRDLLLANIDVRGNMNVADNFIKVNSQVTSTPTQNGGIEVERGTGINAYIMWDEVNDYWAIADETVSSITHRLLDQRDRDALNLRDDNIETDLHTNYVHLTGSVAESITGDKIFSDNVVINGDFTVNGTTTTVNTAELSVSDNIVNLNNDVTGTPTENSGINVVRGTSADTSIIWNESSDTWTLTDDGSNYYKITDQRDVDAIYAAMTGNYVHRTGSVAESISGSKTFTSPTYINNTLIVQSTAHLQGQLNIDDNVITLNYDVSTSPTEDAGIQVERGTSANTAVVWNETTDYWTLTNDGSNYYRIITTNDEGSGKGFDADTVDGIHANFFVQGNNTLKTTLFEGGNLNGPLDSGFYNGHNMTGAPSIQYHNVIVARHPNVSNNYQLQIASDMYGTDMHFRNITDNVPSAWNKLWHTNNDGPGSGLNADLLDGYHGSSAVTANTYALRDASADINARLFRSNYQNETSAATTSCIAFRNNTTDNYIRFLTAAGFSSWCQSSHIKAYDSILLSGLALHASRNNEANKVVRTDGSGYIQAGWINTTSGDAGTATINRVYASYDGFIRYYSLANFAAQVLSQGSTTNAHVHTFLRVPDTRSVNGGPNTYDQELASEFKYRSTVNNPGTSGTYCGVMTFAPWAETSGGNAYQMAFTMENGLSLRTGDLSASSWGAWAKVWHSNNDGHNSGLDADLLDGAQPATSATAGTIAQRDSGGRLYASEFRTVGTYARIATNYGHVDIGPQNSSYSHFLTDRPAYYFDHPVEAITQLKVYGSSTYLTSTAGYIAGNTIWHTGNDGSASGLDADLLDGYHGSIAGNVTTYALRDGAGDITTRLFKSTYPAQTGAPATSADICFRNTEAASDNYMRFMTNTAFSTWCQNAAIKTYDSQRVGGLLPSSGVNNVANQIVRTDSNGYIQAGWINTTSGDAGANTINRVYASYDGYVRYYTPLNFANQILTQGSAKNAHTHPEYAGTSTASLTTTFAGKATGTAGALYVALPAGVPQNVNSYRVAVTATDNTLGAMGDIFVGKYNTYVYIYRTGSYQARVDVIFTW